MCGRFTITCELDEIAAEFGIRPSNDWSLRYNVAPTQRCPVVRVREGQQSLDPLRWGLIPSWSKDAGSGAPLINARAESVSSRPAFRAAFKARRCIVPATGFYEWMKPERKGGKKQPYWVHLPSGRCIGLAGLWECFTPADAPPIESFTIVTTAANETVAPLHDRMPAILAQEHYDTWLNPNEKDAGRLQSLVRPWSGETLALTPVSARVNSPRNDDASLIEQVASAPAAFDDASERPIPDTLF